MWDVFKCEHGLYIDLHENACILMLLMKFDYNLSMLSMYQLYLSQALESASNPFLSADASVTAPLVTTATGSDDDGDLNNVTVQCVMPMYIVQVGSDQTVVTGQLSS